MNGLTECDNCSTRKECMQLKEVVEDLASNMYNMANNMNHLVSSMDRNVGSLVNALSGNTPKGSVPIETHRLVVKGLITAFSIVLVVAIGAIKLLPMVLT